MDRETIDLLIKFGYIGMGTIALGILYGIYKLITLFI